MAVATLNFDTANSGFIQLAAPSTYTIGTGATNCDIYKQTATRPATYKHAIFHFNTSSIPAGSTITKVEFRRVDSLAQTIPVVDQAFLYFGDWIGAALDASAGDYGGGNDMTIDVLAPYSDGDWIDLADGGEDPTGMFSIGAGGHADVKIVDASYLNQGTNFSFNTLKSSCQLRVTYTQNYTKIITENPKINPSLLKKPTRVFAQTALLTGLITKRGIKQPTESVEVTETVARLTGRTIQNTSIITDFTRKTTSRTLNNTVLLSDTPPVLIFGRVLNEVAKVTDSSTKAVSRQWQEIQSVNGVIIRGVGKLLSDTIKVTESLTSNRFATKTLTEVVKVTGSIVRAVARVLRETVLIIMRIVTRFNGQVTALWRRENKDTNTGNWKKQPKDL